MKPLAIVILAAGQSSRLGQNKQLVSIEGQALIVRQCYELQRLNLPIYCLLGYQAEQVTQALRILPNINLIVNDKWSEGLSSSIAAATNALKTKFEQLLFILGDQWQLNAEQLNAFILFNKFNPNGISIATSKRNTQKVTISDLFTSESFTSEPFISESSISELSPPVIFHQRYYNELSLLQGVQGAKSVLKAHLKQLNTFYLPQAFVDLDTPEQLNALRKIYHK